MLSFIHSYPDYREPPWSENRYQFSSYYWKLLAVRLFFVVIFENVIVSVTSLMRWIIPDIPQQLRQQMRQHAYLTNELILQQEYNRAKEMSNENNYFLAANRSSLEASGGGGERLATGYRSAVGKSNLASARMALHTADPLSNRAQNELPPYARNQSDDPRKRNLFRASATGLHRFAKKSNKALSQEIMNKAASNLVLMDDFDLMQNDDTNSLNETSNFYASQYLIESTSRDQLIRH